jgi:hypothetical protein
MTFGGLLSLTPIFKPLSEENKRITTMATAAKNGPLSSVSLALLAARILLAS